MPDAESLEDDGSPPRRRLDAKRRRAELIRATIEILAEAGPREATVRAICARAGVSHGLLRHYFGSHGALITAACHSLVSDYDAEMSEILDQGRGSARDRLRRLFRLLFSPQWIDDRTLGAWVSYWSLVRSDEEVAAVHRDFYARQRLRIAGTLARLAQEEGLDLDPQAEALAIAALMDGLWLEHCLDRSSFAPEAAVARCEAWLDRLTAAAGSQGASIAPVQDRDAR